MLMVEEAFLPLTMNVPGLTDEQFRQFCEQYANYRLEYTAEGELLIMPPTDPRTSIRNARIVAALLQWAENNSNYLVTESSRGFQLEDGSRFAPDASVISRDRLRHNPTCPEFVIELASPEDRRRRLHEKMNQWIANGALLAWLIDPRDRTVTIYRTEQSPQTLTNPETIEGEGPVAGLTLQLAPVWNV